MLGVQLQSTQARSRVGTYSTGSALPGTSGESTGLHHAELQLPLLLPSQILVPLAGACRPESVSDQGDIQLSSVWVLHQCSALALLVLWCWGLNLGPSVCEASTLPELRPQTKNVFEHSKIWILHLIILIFLAFIFFWLLANDQNCWEFNQCSLLIPVSLSPSHCPHSLSPELPFLSTLLPLIQGSNHDHIHRVACVLFSRYLKLLSSKLYLSIKFQPNSSSIWSCHLRMS